MKKFLKENQVALFSALVAVGMVLQQALGDAEMSWVAIGYAALVAGLGRIANAWRGKGLTLLGIIGTVSYAFTDVAMGGEFSWRQFILSTLIAFIFAGMHPPGSLPDPERETKRDIGDGA